MEVLGCLFLGMLKPTSHATYIYDPKMCKTHVTMGLANKLKKDT